VASNSGMEHQQRFQVPERLVRLREVTAVTGMGRSMVYMRISDGLFPRPIKLGVRMVAWPESEIRTLIAATIRGASPDEVKRIVADLEARRANAA
jgi:prophage regulatory protein